MTGPMNRNTFLIKERVGPLRPQYDYDVIDPESGEFVSGGIEAQTQKALENLSAVLEAAGTSLAKVVKTTVFLKDMDDFGAMNGIYGQFFTENYPARSAVQAARLPKDGLVEIEAIALLD